jgi:GNAT superfamily N-acetyltransferase
MSTHRAAFLARVPDDPGHVDLRGVLHSGRCSLFGDPEGGFVVRSWDFPYAVAHGAPAPEVVRRAVEGDGGQGTPWAERGGEDGWHLLAGDESRAAVAAAVPAWPRREVVLHRWEDGATRAATPGGCDLRLAPEGWREAGLHVGHLPPAMRQEMEVDWVAQRPLAAALVDGRMVSFCYAAVETETQWDVSVDTLLAYRRRGLAGACFLTLARYQARRGKRPVWGAFEDNTSSLGLAARLGFVAAARLVSHRRP